MPENILFERDKDKRKDGNWEYSWDEKAYALYNFGEFFVLVTKKDGIDDETAAMADLRLWTRFSCYRYQKDNLSFEQVADVKDLVKLVGAMDQLYGCLGPLPQPVESILLSDGRMVVITEGNLVLRQVES